MSDQVTITIDGKTESIAKGLTIFEAATSDKFRIKIPTICHMPPQTPAGVCRVCVVELKPPKGAPPPPKGAPPKLVAACHHVVSDQMDVVTMGAHIDRARRTLVELLMADHPPDCTHDKETHCELEDRAKEFRASATRYAKSTRKKSLFDGWQPDDDSHPNILVDHDACIVCDRCVRGCTDQAQNFVIGRAGKGNQTVITFDDGHRMGDSSCVSCGECMVSCPTGALTNRGFKSVEWKGQYTPVSIERLLAIEGPQGDSKNPVRLFEGISEKYLRKVLSDVSGRNEKAVVERVVPKGQEICTAGEQGFTAFFIERGRVEVSIPPLRKVASVAGGWSRLLHWMTAKPTSDTQAKHPIPVDAAIDLDPQKPEIELKAGHIFGEMTCLNYYPRSATVKALENDTVVIEIIRPLLLLLMRSKSFGPYLEKLYEQHSIDAIPRLPPFDKVPIPMSKAFLDELRPNMTLVRYKPGAVIFEQGAKSDALYLVRVGFVKVAHKLEGGGREAVVAYRGRNEFFGEIGLLDGVDRTSTCSAADHVDLVRIPLAEFRRLLERYPDIGTELRRVADIRRRTYAVDTEGQAQNVARGDLVQRGLPEAQSLLLLDLDRCTRCDLCAQACRNAHADGVSRLVREGLPITRLVRDEHGKARAVRSNETQLAELDLREERYLVATSCRQCRDPLCMFGCPVGSIHRDEYLNIKIANWCIGCGVCAENCPYGNINMVELPGDGKHAQPHGHAEPPPQHRATVCDLCKDLAREPSCVVACPHGAAIRVLDANAFFGLTDAPESSN